MNCQQQTCTPGEAPPWTTWPRHSIWDMVPSEIIQLICCQLCLHCQDEHAVTAGHDTLVGAFDDQRALARLSQCSKRFRNMAQPVLFHWCHVSRDESYTQQRNLLTRFVGAILRNPRLAASTRALACYEAGNVGSTDFGRGLPQQAYDADGIFCQAAVALGGHLRRRWGPERKESTPSVEELQDLAIASTPGLSHLCVCRCPGDFDQPASWMHWSYSLPNLQYLAFPSTRAGYDLRDLRSLVRCAPNLHTVAADCCARQDGMAWPAVGVDDGQAWNVSLPRLRRLSLNNHGPEELGLVLRGCPRLEDLEYFDHDMNANWLHLERHLTRQRTTLRRLCYSVFPNELFPDDVLSRYIGDIGYVGYAGDDESRSRNLQRLIFYAKRDRLSLDFSAFPALEQLELDQLLLYGPVFPIFADSREDRSSQLTTPDQLFRRLPPSLRRLRVGFVTYWPTVYRDLLALADESSPRFPRLQAVMVEVFKPPPEHQHRHLAERLRAVLDVRLVVRYSLKIHLSRGLLPARPGNPSFVHNVILLS